MINIKFTGRLTTNPELKRAKNSDSVYVNFTIAENHGKEIPASFRNCVAFGKLAEVIAEHTGKGDLVEIVGEHREETWHNKETNDTRQTPKTYVAYINFLQLKGRSEREEIETEEPELVEGDIVDDEIPF